MNDSTDQVPPTNPPTVLIDVVDGPIDLAALSPFLEDPDVGSHGWFSGVTRRTTRKSTGPPRITKELHYEAHRPMALAELRRLANDAQQRFGLDRVVVVHRVGLVPIGDASVVVGCSSAHRKATFQALPWIMDELKRTVPIWKREVFDDGSTQWMHPPAEATATNTDTPPVASLPATDPSQKGAADGD